MKKYNIILVIVDIFTKYSYIIIFKKKYILKQLKIIVLNTLTEYYKILKKITTNRNKLFMFNY